MNYHYQIEPIEVEAINEAQKRSGIKIHIDIVAAMSYMGMMAFQAAGSFLRAQTNARGNSIPDTMFYLPMNHKFKRLEILFHELAHATGTPHRLNREFSFYVLGKPNVLYCKEEVLAEMTSKKLTQHFNLATGPGMEDMNAYISEYSRDLSAEELATIDAESDKVMAYILENWLVDFNKKYASKVGAA